jgi:hypothetical protein
MAPQASSSARSRADPTDSFQAIAFSCDHINEAIPANHIQLTAGVVIEKVVGISDDS